MHAIHDLHHRFIERQQKEWLVLTGDAKVYDVFQSLKREMGRS